MDKQKLLLLIKRKVNEQKNTAKLIERNTQFAKKTCISKNKSAGVSPTPAKQMLAKHPNTPPILDNRNDIGFLLCNDGRNKKYIKNEIPIMINDKLKL